MALKLLILQELQRLGKTSLLEKMGETPWEYRFQPVMLRRDQLGNLLQGRQVPGSIRIPKSMIRDEVEPPFQ